MVVTAEGKANWRADEGIDFANFALEEKFVGPVKQPKVAAVDDKPRWASVGLDDIFEFGTGIFEPGRWMLDDSFVKNLVEFGSFDFLVAGSVDLGGELEETSDVLAGGTAGDEDGRVGQEIKIAFEIV